MNPSSPVITLVICEFLWGFELSQLMTSESQVFCRLVRQPIPGKLPELGGGVDVGETWGGVRGCPFLRLEPQELEFWGIIKMNFL